MHDKTPRRQVAPKPVAADALDVIRAGWNWSRRHVSINASIAAFCAALIGIVWSAVITQQEIGRQEAIAAAFKQNANLAMAFEEHTVRTIKGVDAAMLFLRREYARLGGGLSIPKYIGEGDIDANLFTFVGMADERGDVKVGVPHMPSANFADRDYFKFHKLQDQDKLFVGKPVLGRVSGRWTVPMTRRINKPDGSFGGVVMLAVNPDYFIGFYRQADLGRHGSVDLIGLDGTSRARRAGNVASFGHDMSGTAFMAERAKQPVGDILTGTSLDGVPRYTSYRTLQDYPLVVAVGVAQDEVLAQFLQDRRVYYRGAAWVSLVIALFAVLLIAALARQKRAVAALAATQARFKATFNQSAIGIAYTTPDGRFLQVNQKLCEILGYAERDLLARSFAGITHPDDRAPTNDLRKRLVADSGGIPYLEKEKRYIRRDGSTVWTLVTLSAVRDDSGQVEYCVSMVQDISARKQGERRLQKVGRARKVMAECNRVLVHATDENQFLHDMCNTMVEAGRYRFAWVGFAEHDQYKSVRPVAQAGIGLGHLQSARVSWGDNERGQGPSGKAIRSGRTSLVRNVFTDPGFAPWRSMALEQGYASAITLPLCNQDGAFGILSLRSPEFDAFDDEEIALLETLAADVAYGVASLRSRADHARAQSLLEASERLKRATFDHAGVGIVHTSMDFRYLLVNQKFCDMMGYSRDELLSMNTRGVTHPDDSAGAAEFRAKLLAGRRPGSHVERRYVRKDGTVVWVHRSLSLVRDPAGQPKYFISMVQDATERKRAQIALRESEEQFRQLSANIPEMFWIADKKRRSLVYVSPAYETICGRPLGSMRAAWRNWMSAIHADDRERMLQVYRNARLDGMDQQYRIVQPDGTIRWVQQRGFPVHDASGEVSRIVGITEDITERQKMQQDLLHLAHHDSLTGLPNRGLFYDRLNQALVQAHRHSWMVSVMFIDVDRFKVVNDTLGHSVGDQLLRQVSQRLAHCIRAEDTVARLGGDEFAVMLSDLEDVQDSGGVARKIIEALAEPFQIDAHEVFVTASIGIASYPKDGACADALVKNADTAMYRAKELGKNNYQFYSAVMNERAPQRLQLENDLRHALHRQEFVLHFQPKANLVTGAITGVEALVRWQLPGGELVAPGDFIPLLEETGLIVPVGEWVLRAACAQIKAWQNEGVTPVPVAVNLSARQFHQQDICEMVTRALQDYAVDARFLELEITETAAMQSAQETTATLAALKAIGVRVAIDDFGTGYSSLGYLKRFPIDSLKLDRSFVTELPGDEDDASIAQAVITMAHALRLKVIAEGVENEAQLAFLTANDCDEMQGYFLSRPLPAEQCTQLLREKKKLPLQPASADKLKKPPRLELVVSS